jgi:hypothetical protein
MIEVGQKVKFDLFEGINPPGLTPIHSEKIGTVIEVYEDHRWFSVEYDNGCRISFKFDDIGTAAIIV